ncbi:hypothetical protein ACL1CA_16500, partial [Corynebacterium striatum]
SFRKAWDFDKGVVKSAQTHGQVFVPAGPAAGVYNKLMKRLHKLNASPGEAMQPLPKLAAGVDPYRECLMVCVWVPNLHEETDQNDYCGTTRPG